MMNPPGIYKCNLVLKNGLRCKQSPAEPQFTRPLSEATNAMPQPRWFCEEHGKQYPVYGAITGKLIRSGKRVREGV